MIQPRELRIGNIVFVDNKEFWPELENKALIVCGVEERTDKMWPKSTGVIKVIKNELGEIVSQWNQFITPVPLTEEWLVKFGFCPENDFKHKKAPIYFADIRGNLVCFLHNCSHGHIKYVHQLQNLYFALTGEELTIK